MTRAWPVAAGQHEAEGGALVAGLDGARRLVEQAAISRPRWAARGGPRSA